MSALGQYVANLSPLTFAALKVAFGLSAFAGALVFFLRNELPDGDARPFGDRARGAALAFGIMLVLSVFAVLATTAFAIYFIVWWVTLFAVLPFGVRSQHEGEGYVAGTDPGAPILPKMQRKLILTTAISLPVYLLVGVLVSYLDML